MRPKNLPLFYLALVMSNIGIWLFVLAIYQATVALFDSSSCCGPDIGAGIALMSSWILGGIAAILFVLSYLSGSQKKS